jgi:hypothetical protein
MSEEKKTKKPVDPEVSRPHGHEQQAKMVMLNMIHSAENPYDILYHVAIELERESGEPGFAAYVKDQIHAVYGFALQEEKPLEEELEEVRARLKRIQASYDSDRFSEEEHIRIGFAIDRHKKNIARLEEMIQRAKADKQPLIMKKTEFFNP